MKILLVSSNFTYKCICFNNLSIVAYDFKLKFQDLEDIKIKQKRLKVALKVLNQLKCRICSENFTVVSDYMNHIEECSGVVTNGKVKCVICKVEIDKNEWLKHKLKMHNNLAWRKGDLPLVIKSIQVIINAIIIDYFVAGIGQPATSYGHFEICPQTKEAIILL